MAECSSNTSSVRSDEKTSDDASESAKRINDETSDSLSISTSLWGWYTTAKAKSAEAYELIKRDLSELKETVQIDASNAMSTTVDYVRDTITGISNTVAPQSEDSHESDAQNYDIHDKPEKENDGDANDDLMAYLIPEKAKEKLTQIFETITDAFTINREYDDDDSDSLYMVRGDSIVPIERWKALLRMIMVDPKTYCHEPDGPPEDYESWLEMFNLFDYQTQMVHLLETVPEMKEYHSKLVPHSLSDAEFWHRYYYKVHQLKGMERKRAEIKLNKSPSNDFVTSGESSSSCVQIKMLENRTHNDPFNLNVLKHETSEVSQNRTFADETPSPPSSDTRQSEAGSDDWEKTDLNELNEDIGKNSSPNDGVKSDDDIKDWVKCD